MAIVARCYLRFDLLWLVLNGDAARLGRLRLGQIQRQNALLIACLHRVRIERHRKWTSTAPAVCGGACAGRG